MITDKTNFEIEGEVDWRSLLIKIYEAALLYQLYYIRGAALTFRLDNGYYHNIWINAMLANSMSHFYLRIKLIITSNKPWLSVYVVIYLCIPKYRKIRYIMNRVKGKHRCWIQRAVYPVVRVIALHNGVNRSKTTIKLSTAFKVAGGGSIAAI